jgi:hypothetical protein
MKIGAVPCDLQQNKTIAAVWEKPFAYKERIGS